MQHPSSKPSANSSHSNSTHEEIVSLVHQPSQMRVDDLVEESPTADEREGIAVYLEPSTGDSHLLDSLLTPWGMGAIFLLIIANGFLSWGQWSNTPTKKTAQVPTVNYFNSKLAIPVQTNSLSLNSLSTLTLTPQKTIKPSVTHKNLPQLVRPTTTVKPVATNPGSLTQALLPPSVQPKVMSTYSVAPEPPTLRQSLPVAPLPVASQPVAPPKIELQPAPSPSIAPSNDRTISPQLRAIANEQILEQLRQRENPAATLSFQQRAKARLDAAQRQQNPTEIMQQMQQQQQQQQVAPSSIIIDRSGTSINY